MVTYFFRSRNKNPDGLVHRGALSLVTDLRWHNEVFIPGMCFTGYTKARFVVPYPKPLYFYDVFCSVPTVFYNVFSSPTTLLQMNEYSSMEGLGSLGIAWFRVGFTF